jgi:hypothetical protein
MSSVPPAGRSFRRITDKDLQRRAELATEQRTKFFHRRSDWRRVLCSALCQGAALHYAAGGNAGINDFDIYTFYASHPERP